jgi:hypothetical protein
MRSRGQSTVELALGSLVFVTLILFGVHFGELAVAMLKVKESAHFAAFDVAGHRTDNFDNAEIASGTTFNTFNPVPVGAAAKTRYKDLDGMSDRSGSTWTQALTRVDSFDLSCKTDQTLTFRVNFVGGNWRPELNTALAWLRGRYKNEGGASCHAEAKVEAFRIPTGFVEGGNGMFQAKHRELITIPACGAGFAKNGSCPGDLEILTGDWAMDGTQASTSDDVPATEQLWVNNSAYKNFVEKLFELNGGPLANNPNTAATQLMSIAGGVTPNDTEYEEETHFSMSFQGDVGGGGQPDVPPHLMITPSSQRIVYQTSGADLHSNYVGWDDASGAIKGVPRCHLGLYGCEFPGN